MKRFIAGVVFLLWLAWGPVAEPAQRGGNVPREKPVRGEATPAPSVPPKAAAKEPLDKIEADAKPPPSRGSWGAASMWRRVFTIEPRRRPG
jgi:hypothetical protein